MANTWYFAHPYTAQSRGDKLRLYLERCTGVKLVNPFDQERLFDPEKEPTKVVVQDLELIRSCKGMIAWYPHYTGGSLQIGTSMEVFFARMVCGLPVVIYATSEASKSPWLRAHGKVFSNISDIIKEVSQYA